MSRSAGCAYNEDGQEQAGMGVGVGDYDATAGWILSKRTLPTTRPICITTTVTEPSPIVYVWPGRQYPICMLGHRYLDYDNDGWTDIFYVTGHVYPQIEQYHLGGQFVSPRLVYRNLGNGKFEDVSKRMGPGVTEQFSSRGCAFGDYDNDGDIDVLILNMNDYPSLLRNEGATRITGYIKLLGTHCNRTAIGARVRVVTGKHAQMDEVHSGTSVMSQSDLRLHFGLGQSTQIDLIEVKWPTTQKVEKFTNVPPNQFLTIKEGAGIVKREKYAAKS